MNLFRNAKLTVTIPLLAVLLFACAGGDKDAVVPLKPAWRLVPEAVVLGKRQQFFLYGRHLDSVIVSPPPSVLVEKGILKSDGRVLSLYLTVSPFRIDSLAHGEKNGSREIKFETKDTTATFTVKIVDEVQPR